LGATSIFSISFMISASVKNRYSGTLYFHFCHKRPEPESTGCLGGQDIHGRPGKVSSKTEPDAAPVSLML